MTVRARAGLGLLLTSPSLGHLDGTCSLLQWYLLSSSHQPALGTCQRGSSTPHLPPFCTCLWAGQEVSLPACLFCLPFFPTLLSRQANRRQDRQGQTDQFLGLPFFLVIALCHVMVVTVMSVTVATRDNPLCGKTEHLLCLWVGIYCLCLSLPLPLPSLF